MKTASYLIVLVLLASCLQEIDNNETLIDEDTTYLDTNVQKEVIEVPIDTILDQGTTVFTQGHLSESAHAKQLVADVEGRHAEIISLEASIKELHDMFIEMSTLIELQGEMMDSIEMHCITALEYVQGSNEEIHQFIKLTKDKRALRLKIIGIGTAVSVVLVIV